MARAPSASSAVVRWRNAAIAFSASSSLGASSVKTSFDFGHLHAKSGSLSPLKHFVYDIRDIVRRQPLPGYSLTIERSSSGAERLSFKSSSIDPLAETPRRCRASQPAGDKL